MDHLSLGFIPEPFSSLTHFVGAFVFIPLSVSLIRRETRNRGYRVALGVYCFSCIFLLLMSGVYHLLPIGSSGRAVLQRLDHAAIFLLVAGTFTPIHSIRFRGFWRWVPLVTIWTIAIAGIVLKSVYFSQIPEALSVGVYLGMGWLGAITAGLLWAQEGIVFILSLLQGSLFYSAGALLEFFREPILLPGVIGPHEIFHLMVLAGIAYHWKFIHQATLPIAVRPNSSSL